MNVQRFEIGMMMNNTYVVWCEDTRHGLVVDPVGRCENVIGFVRGNGLTVDYIVYTHAHPDHVSGAAPVRSATQAQVAAHALAARAMRGPLIRLTSGLGLIFRPVAPNVLLKHGDVLTIGQVTLKVLHTPGHTRCGICLLGAGAVFTGDTLIQESVGRTDLPGGSEAQLRRSIREQLLPLSDGITVYPGHGPATTMGHERLRNPFLS